jgi:tRNA(Leu) C34 or U34 (ribose-2'-O)-methylase TrmL
MSERGYAAIGLYTPKKEPNIGGALRAVRVYGASLVICQGSPVRRYSSDTTNTMKHIPLLLVDDLLKATPFECTRIAVEIRDGAKSLFEFSHPERAYYIFGPEDGSVPDDVVERCNQVVYVPTKFCMNLACTVNVILYDRMLKQHQRTSGEGRSR